jgi:hypothetical protein
MKIFPAPRSNFLSGVNVIKLFSSSLTPLQNKLERMSLSSFYQGKWNS